MNAHSMALIEPRLPQELEQIIFEMAIHNDRDSTLPTLLLVARRVWFWLQQYAFETVILRQPAFYDRSKSPLSRPLHIPPGPQQALFVRNLLVSTEPRSNSEPDWTTMLPYCHNIQDFAVWCEIPKDVDALYLLDCAIRSPLRTVSPNGLVRLSASLNELFPGGLADFHHPIFQHLTHLDVFDFPSESAAEWVEGNNYACIPNLRYLSVAGWDIECPVDEPLKVLRKCLEECKLLEVLVFQRSVNCQKDVKIYHTRRSNTVQEVPEDRVVLAEDRFTERGGWSTNWYRGQTGGEDFWDDAEKLVRKWRDEGPTAEPDSDMDADQEETYAMDMS
ncbi:hypothetical protein AX16_006645 [Volvariella volvacea WC 439]|nr:hypothetical protein AX16_006645 [Volvariella volvacea WC 439]